MDGPQPKILEGLRLLVWWHHALRKGYLGPKSTCDECMQRYTLLDRQLAGCGYAPVPVDALLSRVRPWRHKGYDGKDPTVCPGYTTNLPEVQEIARAHLHWTNGALGQFLQGREAPDSLLIGVEIIEAERSKLESHLIDESREERKRGPH